jgi:2'-5' RNA ligase
MPWKIKEEGDEFLVVTKDTDKVVGRHPSRTSAVRHMSALYANVDDAKALVNITAVIYQRVALALKTVHDVSEEARDSTGKWTTGGRQRKRDVVDFDERPQDFARYKDAPDLGRHMLERSEIKELRQHLKNEGRLNPDGRTTPLYHVTDADTAKLIMERGLIPGAQAAPGQSWAATHSKYATYFHGSRDAAIGNAEQAGEGWVVVQANIPVTQKSVIRFLPDEDVHHDPLYGLQALRNGEAVAYIGGVPKSALSVIDPWKTGEARHYGDGGAKSLTSQIVGEMYVNAKGMIAIRALELKGFDPTEARDSSGKWTDGGAVLGQNDLSDVSSTEEQYDVTAPRVAKAWQVDRESLDALAAESKYPIEGKTDEEAKRLIAYNLLRKWGGSSGGAEATVAAMGAAEHVGVEFVPIERNAAMLKWMEDNPKVNNALRSFGVGIYKTTQSTLDDMGVESVRVLRVGGHALDRPFSSWSTGWGGLRHENNGELVGEVVPRKYVLSIPKTGFGTRAESEVVLLPRPRKDVHMFTPQTKSLYSTVYAALKAQHSFASTQVNLPKDLASRVRALGAQVKDSDLAKDGRETVPHITVKYGLDARTPEDVVTLLRSQPPARITLGRLSAFLASETGSESDVLKLEVDSPDLERLNKLLSESVAHTTTFSLYQPHVTAAYVKAGRAERYLELYNELEGTEFLVDEVMFSNQDGEVTTVKLEGARGVEDGDFNGVRRYIEERLKSLKSERDVSGEARDNEGKWTTGSVASGEDVKLKPTPEYVNDLRRDARSRIQSEKDRGVRDYAVRDIYFALGHRADDPELFALAEHIEKASDRSTMFDVLESGIKWNGAYHEADKEWGAARALGANTAVPKGLKPSALTDKEQRAFRARTEFVQAHVRAHASMYELDGDEITVYRGIKGAQGKLVNAATSDEVDFGVRGLSSWTPHRGSAQLFAGRGSTGAVVATRAKLSDVFWVNNVMSSARIVNFSDDSYEVVLKSAQPVRRSKKV